MKIPPLSSLCPLVAVAALAFAPAPALTQGAVPGVTADSIRIGMFGPLTGPVAVGSLPLLGATAIYKSVNDRGGIHGRKITLAIEDDACDPNKSIAAVKKLVSQEEVFVMHGGWCSGAVMAIKPELARTPDVPFMVLGAANGAISTPVTANIFQPVATALTVADSMVDFALSKPGAKRIAVISHSDEWGKSHLEPALARLKEKGLEPVESVALERGQVSATSQILKIKESNPDFVLALLYPAELTIYLRDAYKFGIKAPTAATQAASIEDMVKRVGIPAATKNLFVFYPLARTLGSPEFTKWTDIYRKYNPSEPVETLSFIGMTGALAVVEALQKAGPNPTREKFIAELNRLRDFDPGIQSSALTFTPQKHAGIDSGKMIYMAGSTPTIVSKYASPQ